MARTTSHQPTNDQAAKASAAAMDALNLDDLFLDNDDQGDSLFADMDIDLGDMDGIIGEAAEGGMAAGDVMSEEFDGFFRLQQDKKEEENAALDTETKAIAPTTETSPSTMRTRRRRSKKTEEDDDLQQTLLNGHATSAVSTGRKHRSSSSGAATKGKKRRGGSSRTAASHPSQDTTAVTPLLVTDSIATQQQSLISSIDFMPQKTKRGILPTRKNAMKEHARSPSTTSSSAISQHSPNKNNLPTHTSSATAHPQAPQSAIDQQPTQQQKKLTSQQRAQALVSNYGLEPSRTRFFPYMHLPPEVEVKKGLESKKGQKAFPLLDKLIHASAPDGNDDKGKRGERKMEKDSKDDAEKLLAKTSPLYTLFNQHLGALVDNHGNHHTPEALQKSLHKAKLLASSHLKLNRQPFIDELSKLLASCIKQAAFLRQNLWNMEEWAEDHFGKEDFEASFPARRRDVERIIMKEKGIIPRGISSNGLGDRNATNGSIHYFPTSVVATNAQSPPSPESVPNAPTHGGPNLTPVISVKVKVMCHGWKPNGAFREKFMQNGLEARLWSPVGWKMAAQRANVALAEAIAAAAAAEAATDAATLSPAVAEAVASETLKPYQPTNLTISAPPQSPSKSRKRKLKHSSSGKGGNGTNKSTSGDALTKKAITSSSAASAAHAIQHIPHNSYYHPSILTPTALKHMKKDHFLTYNQQPHIIHFLHTKLFHPSTTPSERRNLLANEISSTLQRMENARLSHQWTRARQMQKELNDLQSIYEEDLDTVPETCNTIGMWRWMERTNFHDKLDEEDVYSGLEGCWQPELDQPQCLGDEGCWGSLLPLVKVSSKVIDRRIDSIEGEKDEKVIHDPSPLFDRLQSLLVEVDNSGDESDSDDDFLLNFSSYSPEQFIHGPKEDPTSDENAVLDVSALTLDQRTFIQLRAARLIDSSIFPDNSPSVNEDLYSSHPSSRSSSPKSPDHCNDESIDTVLQSMKSRLSNLHIDANASVAALQRAALSYASNTSTQRQKERDQEVILAKYRQYQNALKEQKDEKAEKEEKRRISGRIKTGSYKVDGEVWLPW
ncbi:hypothetical protein ACHAXS_006353 [Conticribra weissflogii]